MKPKIAHSGHHFPYLKTALILSGFFAVLALGSSPAYARHRVKTKSVKIHESIQLPDNEILKNSQISYTADGGFTGLKSYGVILSCVNGRVSSLKTIHDPRRSNQPSYIKGTIDRETYLQLWRSLQKQEIFRAASVPEPKLDIEDQFTISFEARAGSLQNEFKVHGINRPEACHLYAIKCLIDSTVQMQAFMGSHQTLAQK